MRCWCSCDLVGLWSEVQAEEARLNSRMKREDTTSLHPENARQACGAIEDGQYRKAIQFLTYCGFVQVYHDVKMEMLAKHPQADPPKLPTSAALSHVKINKATLIRALRSFPQGTAPGPSCLRANYLKEAVLSISKECYGCTSFAL